MSFKSKSQVPKFEPGVWLCDTSPLPLLLKQIESRQIAADQKAKDSKNRTCYDFLCAVDASNWNEKSLKLSVFQATVCRGIGDQNAPTTLLDLLNSFLRDHTF